MSLCSDSMILLFTIYLHEAYVGESYANVLVRGVARCNTCFPSVTLCIYYGYSLSYQHVEVARISSSRESRHIVAKLDNQQRWFSIGVMEFV